MHKVTLSFFLVSAGAAVFAAGPVVGVKCQRESAVFAEGEQVEFVVSTACNGAPTSLPVQVSARYPGINGKAEL